MFKGGASVMALSQSKRAFGVFPNYHQIEGALAELKFEGFPMSQVSVINKHLDREPVQATNGTEKTARYVTNVGAIAGSSVGAIADLAVVMGTAAPIPGMNPLALAGAAAMTLATTLTSSVIAATAGSLLSALISYGIPEEQATVYSDRIGNGEYFVMLEGTQEEVCQAAGVLNRWNIKELRIFDSETPMS